MGQHGGEPLVKHHYPHGGKPLRKPPGQSAGRRMRIARRAVRPHGKPHHDNIDSFGGDILRKPRHELRRRQGVESAGDDALRVAHRYTGAFRTVVYGEYPSHTACKVTFLRRDSETPGGFIASAPRTGLRPDSGVLGRTGGKSLRKIVSLFDNFPPFAGQVA